MNIGHVNDTLKVCIISLNTGSLLVEKMANKLRRMGINYEFRNAVDGRNGRPNLKHGESVSQKKALLKRRVPLTDTEIACYLSHYRLVKDCYDSNVEKLLVLEDDVDFEENFYVVLNRIIKLPRQFELVRLMTLKSRPRKLVLEILPGVMISRPLESVLGTQGYVLNREGMRKIIKRGAEISEPIDKFYDRYWKSNIKSYCVEPHIMWEVDRSTTIAKSKKKNADLSITEYISGKFYRTCDTLHSKLYRFFHLSSFYPCKKMEELPGRTQRFL